MNPPNFCESAKRGKRCIDDLCHNADITLCGLDQEAYERLKERLG